ncbi:MAG: molybdopterin-dependent oxidoreductase [Chloroflexota bacterium]|nr:molybdopterin-dependent oxidoreductase [Chloroflexota bacterium]
MSDDLRNDDGAAVSRRTFLKSSAFLGGTSMLALGFPKLVDLAQAAAPAADGNATTYALAQPENVLYGACLQCNTQCTIKAKSQDGVLVKIDGNPYSPFNLSPWIDYATPPDQATLVDGKLCPKGQSGVQSYWDPYRLRKVLKRTGPRGSNQWKTIPFEQAIDEIVNGGKLFADSGEDRQVAGLKDIIVLTDPKLGAAMAADVASIQAGKMTVADFKQKHAGHLDVLIDPDHPDLGPRNNQFVFQAGRVEPSRDTYSQRFVNGALGSVNWFNHTSICELSHHIAFNYATAQYAKGKWSTGPAHLKPNYSEAEFVIFWGTGAFEANFGPTPMTEQITDSLTQRNFRMAVIDPRLSKTAAKAWKWLPVRSGGDLPLALAMIQSIFDNQRYDQRFLAAANKAAAAAAGQKSWSTAGWLVQLRDDGTPGAYLRAKDIGLEAPAGKSAGDLFVVLQQGSPVAVDPYDEKLPVQADLLVDTSIGGKRVKSALALLRAEASAKSMDEWAGLAGIDRSLIEEVAAEFTSHGPRAAIDFYRGAVKHWNGYYTGQAIVALNLLIGNPDWKGGLAVGGGAWNAMGGTKTQPFSLGAFPGKRTPFGVKLTREGSFYDRSTLFAGYPAKRPWFPFTSNVYQEVLPAAQAAYPYPIKALWLHMGNPGLLAPANQMQVQALRDTKAVPLLIADDIVLGDSSLYADYIFPDISYLERWAVLGAPPTIITKLSEVRQPVAPPIPEPVTIAGETMPISMEAMMIALAGKLAAPGFGAGGFGPGIDLKRPEDFFLRAVANLAAGDGPNDAVPDADAAELELFRKARAHLPPSVYDESKWQATVGAGNWRKVVYVLNRGGRFEGFDKSYSAEHLTHAFGKLWDLYVEPVGTARDSMTGLFTWGLPHYAPPAFSDGSPIQQDGFAYDLSSFKEIFGAKRTVSNYWSQLSLLPENFVLVSAADGPALRLQNDDRVRLVSASNPDGVTDLGPLGTKPVEGKVRLLAGLRPGTVTVSLSYGHWGYGAADATVDGVHVPGDARRRTGLIANSALLLDKVMKTTPVTDPIGGSASFFDTRVKIVKV